MPLGKRKKKQASKFRNSTIPSSKSKEEIKREKEESRLENLSADQLINEGNQLLKKFTFFSSSKLENKLKALDRFQYAIPLLRVDEKHSEAANLSLQMGEIYDSISWQYRQDKLICYWNAAKYIESSDTPRAILILEELCYPLIHGFFPRYQGTYYQKIISLYTQIGNLTEAINVVRTAINYYYKLKNCTQIAKLYAKLGYLYSANGDSKRAIFCLANAAEEVLADITYAYRADAKEYYLDASLVALYYLPLSNAINEINNFIRRFPAFTRGYNYSLLHYIIKAIEVGDERCFNETLASYQSTKGEFSQWRIGALRNIQIVLNDEIGKKRIIDLSV